MTAVLERTQLATGEVTFDIPALLNALPLLKATAGGRVAIPANSYVRFDGTGLAAFDFDNVIQVTAIDDMRRMTGAVRFTDLAAAIRLLPRKGRVTFTASADGTRVQLGEVNAEAMPTEELADLPTPTLGDDCGVWDNLELADLVKVATAAGTDDTLPVLTAVRIAPEGSASTDRYRLHHAADITSPIPLMVPAKVITMLGRAMKGRTVYVSYGDCGTGYRYAHFATVGLSVLVRLLDGEYPRYGSLIPTETTPFHSNRLELADAVEAAGRVVHRTDPVRLTQVDGGLEVTAVDPDGAVAFKRHVRAIDVPAGWESAFNAKFLSGALRAVEGAVVTVGTTDQPDDSKKRLILLSGSGRVRAIVMPVNLAHTP